MNKQEDIVEVSGDRKKLQDTIKELQTKVEAYKDLYRKVMIEKDLLTKERDESRRMYCDVISQNVSYGKSKTQKAEDLKWDCFKGLDIG